jgi:hypothetical protein
MGQAKLIKKAEREKRASLAPQAPSPRRSPALNTHETLAQWAGTYRNARRADPRAAFAALFNVGA